MCSALVRVDVALLCLMETQTDGLHEVRQESPYSSSREHRLGSVLISEQMTSQV